MDSESNAMDQEHFCRGSKSDSQVCDCEEFFAWSQDEGHCVECGHGRSKHPRKASTRSGKPLEVQEDEQPHRLGNTSAVIKDIFDRIASGGKSVNEKLSTTKRLTEAGVPLTNAREEALSTLSSTRLAGYSKLAKGPVSLGLRKDRKDTMSSSLQPSKIGSQARRSTMSNLSTTGANTFRVTSIALLTCGVNRNGLIRVPKAPTKNGQNEIQAMKNRGCYLDQPEQFIIDSGCWFPKVFDFLDIPVEKRPSAPSRSLARPTQDEKPIWRLLNKSGQTLTVVDVAFPTGTDLMKHKGRDKASVSECHLWFVIAGSYSEHNDCSDVLLSDVDSLNDSFISKSDNELVSSLMELELTDAEVEDPKGKGKMKVVSPKRTNMKRTRTVLSPEQSPSENQLMMLKLPFTCFFTESGPSTGSQPFLLTQLAQSNSLKMVLFRSSPLGVPAGTAI
ncbi:uncharacterized protein F5891DRAFT_974573 [Suillus fuscotomentosus]|uniref:Uncharacterized protein n=1 Tax=Suillus fuscotomentosus TaxID=1912939 RepID=A0AAD4EN70_9AGAM|nr:uncharacterized protein F5891DRAFT_974573 [Suillus fuscotomentosus]KAG1907983.1 hypothetical protein F5891DRAFT_974573 [Suillus fuscotomentosus]